MTDLSFFLQQLFRSQQNAQALGQAAGQPTAAQLQLIQQQQYLAQQQPLQQAAFPQPQYVLNPQAPQVIKSIKIPKVYILIHKFINRSREHHM